MVRRYVPKKSTARVNKDRRMAAVVRLRGEGLSLRAIASQLHISDGTVRNDLARWAELHPDNVTQLRNRAAQNCPPGGTFAQSDCASTPTNVVPIRRTS